MKRLRQTFGVFLLSAACCFAQSAVPLGTSANFAILAGSTVTNTGTSTIVGGVGVSPGSSITGFPPGTVSSGTIHRTDAAAGQAETDLGTAYGNAAGQMATMDLTGQNLGGLTLSPGVYHFSTSAQLTGTLTLNGGGNSNAIFIFQIGTTLTTATSAVVSAINGAQAANIFWQVGSSATLGTSTIFVGNILALTSITSNTSVLMAGRLLAINGAVTVDTISLTYPTAIPPGGLGGLPPSPTPAPSSWMLLLIGLVCAILYQTHQRWVRPLWLHPLWLRPFKKR
ncbi:MAG: ice-binding family protein [Bryobacteraceae bacterium]